MSDRAAIVFRELISKFPNLQGSLGELGLSCHTVDGGRMALEQAQRLSPALLLLDVAMPELSGIECWRQIKEGAFAAPPKIVLISSLESSGVAQRAEDAGCDHYILESQVHEALPTILSEIMGMAISSPTLVEPSHPSVEAKDASAVALPQDQAATDDVADRRVTPRMEAKGKILYFFEDDTFHGELINLSLTGLLFAAARDIPVDSLLTIRFRTASGQEFDLRTKVVRTVAMKTPKNGLSVAVGATFEKESAEDEEMIDWLLDTRLELKLPQLSPDRVRNFLDGDERMIAAYMRREVRDDQLDVILGQRTPFESAAFTQESSQADCVRRLVFLRAQFRVFRAFIPVLAKNPGLFAGIFLPLLPPLVDRAVAIEEESNQLVRQAVDTGDEAGRVGLNQTSNALYDARVSLTCILADHMPSEGLGEFGDVIRQVKEEAKAVRSRQTDDFDQKYARRAPIPEPVKKTKDSDFIKSLSSKGTWIMASIAFVIVAAGGVGYHFSQRVAPNELQLPPGVSSIRKVDNGIDVRIRQEVWTNWPAEDRELLFTNVEKYMAENRHRQATLTDENGNRMIAILGARYGQDWVFKRRSY